MKYKESEEAKQRLAKNKANATKNLYHHKLGTGGYKSAMPKWDQTEAGMLAQGIIPETHEWATRHRNWVLGHGGEYNTQTGDLIQKEKIAKPLTTLKTAIKDARQGKFKPDRENDELT